MTGRTHPGRNVQLAQEIIVSASKILTLEISWEQAFHELLAAICQQLDCATGSFWKLDEANNVLRCPINYTREPCPQFHQATISTALHYGEGLPGRVWSSHVPVWLPDVTVDSNFPRIEAAIAENLHAALAFPINVKGRFIGAFEFFAKSIAEPDADMTAAFSIVSTALGQFLDRRSAELALAEQSTLNSYSAEIGTALNSIEGLPPILRKCADLTVDKLGVALCRVWLRQEQANAFELASEAGKHSDPCSVPVASQVDENGLSLCLNSNEPTACSEPDGKNDSVEPAYYCAFPLSVNNEMIGALSLFGSQQPSAAAIHTLSRVASNLSLCIARKRSEEKLAASESRFREFAGVVDECFFISSPRLTQHFYVSPGFEKIWGFSSSEVFRDANAWMYVILPDHRTRVADYVNQLSGETMPDQLEIDYPIRRPDGRVAWLSARCFRIDQGDGRWHICGTVRDITARKEAEERISEFYSAVSHELRTPLTSIKGSLLLLERGKGGQLPERANQLILIARRESDRLIRLINDMLDMKTIEVGKLQLYYQTLSPDEVVAPTVELMKNLAAEAAVDLKVEINTQRSIYADKDRVVQVLTNLLSNAVKFSPADREVLVTVTDRGGYIRFSVSDCGSGIQTEDQPRLFTLFPQMEPKDRSSKHGTGLGLAISKGIIDQHHGNIGVMSKKGAGATFWFELPAVAGTQ